MDFGQGRTSLDLQRNFFGLRSRRKRPVQLLLFLSLCGVSVSGNLVGCAMQAELTTLGNRVSVASPGFSMSTTSGAVGSVVTLSGLDFLTATSVTVNGTPAIILSRSASQLSAFVMPGSTTGPVAVTIGATTYSSSGNFSVNSGSAPTVQQGAKLVGTGGNVFPDSSLQGRSIALSADGNTMAVGGNGDNSLLGAVWIFTRSGSIWTQQGSKIVPGSAIGNSQFGTSVKLSADGNTLAVGGPQDNSGVGAVWIFTRAAGVWSQQAKLIGTGGVGAVLNQGQTVAMSADGNTVASGAPYDNSSIGAAWVFTRSGSTWTQQGSKLSGAGTSGPASEQGAGGLALSADGNTLAIGGHQDNWAGGTWIFVRSAGVWSAQGGKILGTGAVSNAFQGISVALSGDGNTLVVGGSRDNTWVGAFWVFNRSGSTWSQVGAKLTPTGAVGMAQRGNSVNINAAGTLLSVSGWQDNGGVGAIWLYSLSGSVWSQVGSKLIGSGAVGSAGQGVGSHLSADGSTLGVGGYADGSALGAAWVFAP